MNKYIMKIAVIQTGGKQYQVCEGQTIQIETLLELTEGAVNFDQVLLVGEDDGKDVKVGAPTVEGATVAGTIVEAGRTRKVRVVKYKPKTRENTVNGHRQNYLKVKIESIKG